MISDLMAKVKPSPTIAMSNTAKAMKEEGIDVLDFSLGEADFSTPKYIIDAAHEALSKGLTKYTPVDGTNQLKEAIIRKFKRENNLDYTIKDITCGNGVKQIIFNALCAIINPEDEVIIPTPSWVSYFDMVQIFGGRAVSVATSNANHFILQPEDLEKNITHKTKCIMFNSPNNPSGAIYSSQDWRKIADILLKYPGIFIIADDIYEHIIYDNKKHTTILEVEPRLSERTIIVNGVSKAYCMTGFRIGYGASKNQELIKTMRIIQSQSTTNPCSVSQYAATIALDSSESIDFIDKTCKIMEERMNLAIQILSKSEYIKAIKPSGAFYLFPDISKCIGKTTKSGKIILSGDDFCEALLKDYHVAVVGGEGFGVRNHFRLSFTTSNNRIELGINQIIKMIQELS